MPFYSVAIQSQNIDKNSKYRNKYKYITKRIKGLLIENAALCDEVAKIQESILIVKEERRFLLRKLLEHETDFDVPQPLRNVPSGYVVSNGSNAKNKKRRSPENNGKCYSVP